LWPFGEQIEGIVEGMMAAGRIMGNGERRRSGERDIKKRVRSEADD
jgi:hypothetical protein